MQRFDEIHLQENEYSVGTIFLCRQYLTTTQVPVYVARAELTFSTFSLTRSVEESFVV